ncbi:hypothetical protein BP5796_12950 [Coleophoma crateriformis]|uniref:HpcH/HpaI aldolase/citrate lyase domain-containing protein n=1 Tax=Coleophoma crateriformis TaxID=565419 RepID=A0A3D8Q4Z4_9HELO|nr:hypothetical protein BP5796_12950 [Coleophoma crateriformis]
MCWRLNGWYQPVCFCPGAGRRWIYSESPGQWCDGRGVSTPWDAKAAIRICKNPGLGKRSVVGSLPQLDFTLVALFDTFEYINENASTVNLMIESQEGLRDVEAIASMEGADCLFIGSNDLSVELGVSGDYDSDIFPKAIARIAAAATKHDKILGISQSWDYALLWDRKTILLGQGLKAAGAAVLKSRED